MKLSPLGKYLGYQLYHAILLLSKIEPEEKAHLHQFRVSLRRVRSLFKLYLRKSLPFPHEIKELLRQTNTLRELDVLTDSINPSLYPDAYARLDTIRKNDYASILSPSYRHETALKLNAFYDTLLGTALPTSKKELVDTLKAYYDKTLRKHEKLPPNAPQEEVHALRIRYKITRYGLEFLQDNGLYEAKEKIKKCKSFQEALGDYQDIHNQIELLMKLYEETPIKEFKLLIQEREKRLKKLKGTS